jgi:transposase InsO family protein
MQIHSNATTNPNQRRAIRNSNKTCRALAAQYHVWLSTVSRWKGRDEPADRSCRPKNIEYAFDEQEEALLLCLRAAGFALDDLVEAVEPVLEKVSRSSVHRLLVRHGVNRLPKKAQQDTGHLGSFKEYGPGYLHIDLFYLPKLEETRRYCFVAVDRATRLVYLSVFAHKDAASAEAFLKECLEFFPFQIEKILTDNVREWTLAGFKNRYGSKVTTQHPFERLCQEQGIEHRRTRPYTPKTNGLVERTNGLIKEGTTKKNTYRYVQEMEADLHSWLVRYNFYRKHRRLGGKTPYEAALKRV